MARFNNGWVKIHRKLDEHWLVGKDLVSYAIFNKLVCWANIVPKPVKWKGKKRILERGQLMTGLGDLIGEWDISLSTVSRKLREFEDDGMILQEVTNEGRVITICNYGKYQDQRQTTDKRLTNEWQTTDKRLTNEWEHIKEEKKNIKKVRSKEGTPLFSETEIEIAEAWLKYSKTEMPWKATDKSWTVENWAKALVELKRKTDLNDEGLRMVLAFVSKDHFWAKNAVSPRNLLAKSKSNGQRKIDNILVNFKSKSDRKSEALDRMVDELKNEVRDPSIPEGHLF